MSIVRSTNPNQEHGDIDPRLGEKVSVAPVAPQPGEADWVQRTGSVKGMQENIRTGAFRYVPWPPL